MATAAAMWSSWSQSRGIFLPPFHRQPQIATFLTGWSSGSHDGLFQGSWKSFLDAQPRPEQSTFSKIPSTTNSLFISHSVSRPECRRILQRATWLMMVGIFTHVFAHVFHIPRAKHIPSIPLVWPNEYILHRTITWTLPPSALSHIGKDCDHGCGQLSMSWNICLPCTQQEHSPTF
jgi:hypothetical protein